MLHRDIKPSNLLLDVRGTVWVADFGLAKSNDADDLTHAGDFIGTIRYMAPERFEGAGDHRADVYALGLTLYELLTLRPAFVADTRTKLVEQAIAANPPKPRTVNPAIPRDLETVVLKAIQRDPAGRYQSAAELADDLRRFIEDRSILARRATPTEQAVRWCRRNPTVAGLLAAVLVITTLGAVVASVFAVQADTERKNALTREQEANRERARANEEAEKLKAAREQQAAEQYLSDMQLMPHLFETAYTGELMRVLDGHIPKPGETDRRCFEWHYWNRRVNAHVGSAWLPGEHDPAGRCFWATSADGTKLARATGVDRSGKHKELVLTVWDVHSRKELFSRPVPLRAPNQPAVEGPIPWGFNVLVPQFSADGRRVLVGTESFLRVLDTRTGETLAETLLADEALSREVRLSRDGRRMLVMPPGVRQRENGMRGREGVTREAGEMTLRILDVDANKPADTSVLPSGVQNLILHPDGETYLIARRVSAPELSDHLAALVGATPDAFEASTRIEVRVIGTDTVRRWWPVPNGTVSGVWGQMAISSDGRTLAAAVSGELKM